MCNANDVVFMRSSFPWALEQPGDPGASTCMTMYSLCVCVCVCVYLSYDVHGYIDTDSFFVKYLHMHVRLFKRQCNFQPKMMSAL